MPQGYPLIVPQRLGDVNYAPADGDLIYTWTATSTFTTPLTTYSDTGLTTANTNPIETDASGYYNAFVAAGTQVDVEVKNAAGVLQYTRLGLLPMASSTAPAGAVAAYTVTFAETATGVSHVASIAIPAGATLLDAQTSGGVLWGAAAVVYKLGDTADDDGYFIGVNLKATDLLPGEVLSIAGGTSNWGGKNGAYLNATTGQRGPAASNFGTYYAAGSNIVATITVTTPSVTTGRTYLTVFYATGIVTAPVVT